jgi:hypothetical protein
VLFFPDASLLALELSSKKTISFRMCDSDGNNSVLLGSQIDSWLTEKEDFPIPISTEAFLNDWSSRLQSIDVLFGVFCGNNFVSVPIILILMTT